MRNGNGAMINEEIHGTYIDLEILALLLTVNNIRKVYK
jgi:hypothetical protein